MNCFFSYTIKYYDELDRAENVITGVVNGNSLIEAITKIADYYGDENIIRILDFSYLNNTVVLECKDAEFRFPAHFECDYTEE